jgi:hypothetical protein
LNDGLLDVLMHGKGAETLLATRLFRWDHI